MNSLQACKPQSKSQYSGCISTFCTVKNRIVMKLSLKGICPDSVTSYNYVGNTKVSVSIKKTNANKCTLSEIFLTEILKSFSVF